MLSSNLGTEVEFLAEDLSPLVEGSQDAIFSILVAALDSVLERRMELIAAYTGTYCSPHLFFAGTYCGLLLSLAGIHLFLVGS
jgi:hypothetical protein